MGMNLESILPASPNDSKSTRANPQPPIHAQALLEDSLHLAVTLGAPYVRGDTRRHPLASLRELHGPHWTAWACLCASLLSSHAEVAPDDIPVCHCTPPESSQVSLEEGAANEGGLGEQGLPVRRGCSLDKCLNALLSTECTPGHCPTGEACQNQVRKQKEGSGGSVLPAPCVTRTCSSAPALGGARPMPRAAGSRHWTSSREP